MLLLFKKYNYHAIAFSYMIFFIYAQACYVDYLLFDIKYFSFFYEVLDVHVEDENFYLTTLVYFTFLVSYSIYPLFIKKKLLITNDFNTISKYKLVYLLINIVFIFILIILNYKIVGLDRDSIKLIFVKSKIMSLLIPLIVFYWIIISLDKVEKNKLIYTLLTINIFVLVLVLKEREYIVYLLLVLFYRHFNKISNLRFYIYSFFGILLIMSWKIIYKYFSYNGELSLYEHVFNGRVISLSKADPLVSFLLISDFFDKNIYQEYYFSYLYNTFAQLIKTFVSLPYESLGRYTTMFFTEGNVGTAYSMILESLLNFYLFGPIILGFILSYIYLNINKFVKFNNINILNILIIIFSLKLVRTELAVVLKLYVVPMLGASLVYFFHVIKSKK